MEPSVHHSHFDQSIDPRFLQQVFVVGLAKTGADAGENFLIEAILKSLHGLIQNTRPSTALITNAVGTFDTDQRGDVTAPTKSCCDFGGDEMTVRKNLEVGVWVCLEDFEDLFVHERFTAEQPEERVAHPLGLINHSVKRFHLNLFLLVSDVDPATLTT